MLIKLGEAHEIRLENTESCIPEVSAEVLENFRKTAANLKRIAPKAEDFLYFSAVMMHAAEASALNDDGSPKLTSKGEKVEVGWDTSNNTYKWTTNDSSVKPYKNCFTPDTFIMLEDGSVKTIDKICIGDKVITHTGKAQKVSKIFITPHSGNLLELTINNNLKLKTTENHPIYSLKVSNNNWKNDTSPFRIWNEKNTKFDYKFITSENLKEKDLLLSPVFNNEIESNLTPNLCRILGLYAAEGSLHKKIDGTYHNEVNWTFSKEESNTLAILTKNLLEEEFKNFTITIKEHDNKTTVSLYGKDIYKLFLKYVGEYSYHKKIHPELMFSTSENKKQFILGWLEGDGHIQKDNRVTGTTVSPNLAFQIRTMLYSLGIHNTLYTQPPSNSVINGRKIIGNYDVFRLRINGTNAKKIIKNSNKLFLNESSSKDRDLNKFTDKYCVHPLLEKKFIAYEGDVYNLEVEEDHSYVANGLVVSNCNGDIFPESQLVLAHKKWRNKPLCIDHKSNSVDHVRGFIVDTVYDRQLKRVIALCALDKAGFPQLARQVSTGVSNCVSMGTAVGRAVCSDCGTVARTEADFCRHMKDKTCYGEINLDLNPLELSIVVNGADPKANIKHIIAAANTMNTYLDNRSKELNKLAELVYTATISVGNNVTGSDAKTAEFNVKSTDLNKFKTDIDDAFNKLQEFKTTKISEKDTNLSASNQSSINDDISADSGLALQTPQNARFASANIEAESITELQTVTAAIEAKLHLMKQSLDKLAKTSTNIQEENMSGSNTFNKKEAYFQGAGGVNEPTPGQVKYPKDPLNEQLRENEDKQMLGQSPFPEVGPVDGMHPSPDSADPSGELERKKMLARAEAEDRAMKRNAVVRLAKQALENKQAYVQGGGGVNEPTPGKVKYPKDKLNEELRDYEDKQMVGQPPFPGVGSVDGLHPSPSSADVKDELKRKEMHSRASLRARFVKAANENGSQNKAKSAWEVFLGDKLLLTASVDELSAGRTDMFYDSIATKEFGSKLIEKVKVSGADVVSKLIKKAQVPPAPPAEMAPAPESSAPPADLGAPPVEDAGKSGDPKQNALDLAEKSRDLGSDLVEAVRALTGEQAEMGGAEDGAPPAMADDSSSKTASSKFSDATLNTLRKELNGALTHAMKESIAELNDHQQELEMIAGMYDKGAVTDANKDFVGTIIEDALNEAKTAVADGFKLMNAFVKYARGTKAIVKRAELEAELEALAEGDSTMSDGTKDDSHSADGGDLMGLINDTNADLDAVKMMVDDHDDHDGMSDLGLEGLLEDGEFGSEPVHEEHADLELEADDNDMKGNLELQPGEMPPKGFQGEIKAAFDTREGRNALRAKLAADASGKEDDGEVRDASKEKFSDMLDAANKLTDGQTELDVKPSGNLGKVETLSEVNKAMMDLAKAPPKVRKEAEAIQRLVSEGKLSPQDVDALVAEGLDKDAVSYWKKYYGETDGGSEFASELVKEHVKAQMESEINQYRVKLARAYELAYDMAERGLCHHERSAISSQVDEIMKFNDDSFDSLKRVVARHNPVSSFRKEAGRIPQVGLRGDNDVTSSAAGEEDVYTQLSSMFGTKKGMF